MVLLATGCWKLWRSPIWGRIVSGSELQAFGLDSLFGCLLSFCFSAVIEKLENWGFYPSNILIYGINMATLEHWHDLYVFLCWNETRSSSSVKSFNLTARNFYLIATACFLLHASICQWPQLSSVSIGSDQLLQLCYVLQKWCPISYNMCLWLKTTGSGDDLWKLALLYCMILFYIYIFFPFKFYWMRDYAQKCYYVCSCVNSRSFADTLLSIEVGCRRIKCNTTRIFCFLLYIIVSRKGFMPHPFSKAHLSWYIGIFHIGQCSKQWLTSTEPILGR